MEGARPFPQLIREASPQTDPSTEPKEAFLPEKKIVDREYLINKLNYINFQEKVMFAKLKHRKHTRFISLPLKPLPCDSDILDCLWQDTKDIGQKLKTAKFENLQIPNGQTLIVVKPEVIGISERGCRLRLPKECVEIRKRRADRHYCSDVNVQLIQSSAEFSGRLIDFSPSSFRIEIQAEPPKSFHWILSAAPVTIILTNDNGILYSGDCKIVRQSMGKKRRKLVLEPIRDSIQRFKPKEFRSRKHRLTPSPDIVFEHPLTKRIVNLKVIDLSGSGLSVEENESSSVLVPGLIIPDMEICFTNHFAIRCVGQVIYRKVTEEGEVDSKLKFGLAFLDMHPEDLKLLLGLLHQTNDAKSYVCNTVDLDALWNFFFEVGFIYPKKYTFIEANKVQIKAIYKKLYTESPSIARHYIYQENGRILGHMAMIRFYHRAWLIHHHAANTNVSNKAGLVVLSQISRYVNEVHNIYSHHLDYVYCYYRPENKFPERVFGGVSRNIKNPKGCSLDTFAYFHFHNRFNNELDMHEPWHLSETQAGDLAELESYYEDASGGLMITALDLEPDTLSIDDVADEYRRHGFKRERHLYSLKKDGKLKAIAMINLSDIGLNMSDLTHCAKIIVTDPNDLPKSTLYLMLSLLFEKYEQKEMPVLLYPTSYGENESISHEKLYTMWVLNLQNLDDYFRYLTRLLRYI